MPHEFESGIFYRQPAWHQLGTVVEEWPGSWEQACKLADLTWEVEVAPVLVGAIMDGRFQHGHANGWQALMRNDKPHLVTGQLGDLEVNSAAMLSIQPSSYKVIKNAEFGEVIESVVGEFGDDWAYETLISLSGGKNVICLLRARQPLDIKGDGSKTYLYLCFTIRHDGQGGLRIIPTSIRVVCKNTHNYAEHVADREKVGFTIRHTANWEDRISQVRTTVAAAVKSGKAWETLANKLIGKPLRDGTRDWMLASLFKTDSSMTETQLAMVKERREQVIGVLGSETCEYVNSTMYGFVQAVDEWVDHVKPAHNAETRTARSLLRVDNTKFQALQLAMAAADL